MSSIQAQCGNLKGTIRAQGVLKGKISKTVEIIGSVIQPLTVTENNTYSVPEGVNGFNPVTVAVPVRYEEGYSEGRNAERNEFWEVFQEGGKRTSYTNAFSNGWTDDIYNPKYPLESEKSTGATVTTMNGLFSNSKITDTKVDLIFHWVQGTNMFYGCSELITIRKLILDGACLNVNTNVFYGCSKLQNIAFEGEIISNLHLHRTNVLSVDSMKSAILCLKNYAGTADAFKYTLKFSETCLKALEAEGNTSPNGNNWIDYMTDLGWNY